MRAWLPPRITGVGVVLHKLVEVEINTIEGIVISCPMVADFPWVILRPVSRERGVKLTGLKKVRGVKDNARVGLDDQWPGSPRTWNHRPTSEGSGIVTHPGRQS